MNLAQLTLGRWFDLSALFLLILLVIWHGYRGLSASISKIIGLILAAIIGHALTPKVRVYTSEIQALQSSELLSAIAPYIVSIILGITLYIILRIFFRLILKCAIESQIDHTLGAIAGIIKWLLIMLITLSLISLMPETWSLTTKLTTQSWIGEKTVPKLRPYLIAKLPHNQK